MKLQPILLVLILALVVFGAGVIFNRNFDFRDIRFTTKEPPPITRPSEKSQAEGDMALNSPVFQNGKVIPAKFTCDGENFNPPLSFEEVNPDAASLALIVDDPDAPNRTFTHWLVWNIDGAVSQISENSLPKGAAEGVNDAGKLGYTGPCPPSGEHRYFFKLYALNDTLDLEPGAGKDELIAAMDGKVIDEAELIGLYERR